MRVASTELTCRDLVELVTEYVERTLSAHDRARFERHLRECEGCSAYLEQMRQTIRTLGQLTEDTVSDEARDSLLRLFRGWKNPAN